MSLSIVHSERKQTPVAWSAKPFGQELDPTKGECHCSLSLEEACNTFRDSESDIYLSDDLCFVRV